MNTKSNSNSASGARTTGVAVHTSFPPLSVFFYFCSPVVEINGQPKKSSWGSQFFELPEGEHVVTVYVPYLFWKRCGENSVTVRVTDGRTAKVTFAVPLVVTQKGSINVLE